jgi:predicted RNA-binding protein with PUA-like domain
MAKRWLFKTEPRAYAYADLERDGRTVWDGVTNALALAHLRSVAAGDEVLIYHTGDEKAAVGLARVVRSAYPDPRRKDARLVVVDIVPVRALADPVPLAAMRANPRLAGFDLLRLPRLSVMPVSAAHWAAVVRMARSRAAR